MEYKPQDVVVCMPGFIANDNKKDGGGCGYNAGDEFVVKSVSSSNQPNSVILWREDNGGGVHSWAVCLKGLNYEIY